jgi:hypothetical protein
MAKLPQPLQSNLKTLTNPLAILLANQGTLADISSVLTDVATLTKELASVIAVIENELPNATLPTVAEVINFLKTVDWASLDTTLLEEIEKVLDKLIPANEGGLVQPRLQARLQEAKKLISDAKTELEKQAVALANQALTYLSTHNTIPAPSFVGTSCVTCPANVFVTTGDTFTFEVENTNIDKKENEIMGYLAILTNPTEQQVYVLPGNQLESFEIDTAVAQEYRLEVRALGRDGGIDALKVYTFFANLDIEADVQAGLSQTQIIAKIKAQVSTLLADLQAQGQSEYEKLPVQLKALIAFLGQNLPEEVRADYLITSLITLANTVKAEVPSLSDISEAYELLKKEVAKEASPYLGQWNKLGKDDVAFGAKLLTLLGNDVQKYLNPAYSAKVVKVAEQGAIATGTEITFTSTASQNVVLYLPTLPAGYHYTGNNVDDNAQTITILVTNPSAKTTLTGAFAVYVLPSEGCNPIYFDMGVWTITANPYTSGGG